jgi:hypothetical protein
MEETIALRITRACLIEGIAHAAGEIVGVSVEVAAAALDSGRVELIDKLEAARIAEHRKGEVARALRSERRPTASYDVVGRFGDPWRPV